MFSESKKIKILAVVGPTASGKTTLAIALAKRFNGEIIAADSRTVYRGMDIGTAKPKGTWKSCLIVEDIPHWGIDLVEPDEEFNVSHFQEYAKKKIHEITGRGRLPMLVGGTGLWVEAVVDALNLSNVPPDLTLRAEFETRSVNDLFTEYKHLDPEGALVIDDNNKRRLVRALEVCRITGRPFSSLRRKGDAPYNCFWLAPDISKEELDRRIDVRVDEMVAQGLVTEVRALYDRFGCDAVAMSGIGYRQICRFFEDKCTLAEAIGDIKKDTRQYAKRQLTWFRRNERIHWVKGKEEAVITALELKIYDPSHGGSTESR
ncbi:MAG TPA: tRNA (adenosine(37)-N6)-dimethylallyltransferase MiaA [Patescibacteria group bacterium]|nr:tRNA (adenosine(37)-N6)-dimethylallyltransferase MiaA [Patescibacteria group bacterium]